MTVDSREQQTKPNPNGQGCVGESCVPQSADVANWIIQQADMMRNMAREAEREDFECDARYCRISAVVLDALAQRAKCEGWIRTRPAD